MTDFLAKVLTWPEAGQVRGSEIMATQLLQLDTRKRVSLAKIATADNYIATTEASGRIILDPAVVMTEVEASLMADPELREQVESRMAANGPTTPRRQRRS